MKETIKKVLVAEDERPLSKALNLKLSSNGFDCQVANDGQEAVDLLKKGNFDFLLLDLVMPIIDGFGVMEAIKDSAIKTKVIVLSNLSQTEDLKRAKELGAINFFIKSDTQLNQIIKYLKDFK